MEEREASSTGFQSNRQTDSKIVDKQRNSDDSEEGEESSRKRRHPDSVLKTEGIDDDETNLSDKQSSERLRLQGEQKFQGTKISQILEREASEGRDIDTKMSESEGKNFERLSMVDKQDNNERKATGLDLNADAVSSSDYNDLFFLSSEKQHKDLVSKDVLSECGSSTGSIEEKDSMKRWKEMKRNGFLSCSHGGILGTSLGGLPMAKRGGRKSKNEIMKKRIEIAKRDETDRFAKLAAPTGLLNQLNPGIIHHVRNKKQVLNMIQNLVRSEKDTGNCWRTQMNNSGDRPVNSKKDVSLQDHNQTFKGYATTDEESSSFSSAGVLTLKAATVASNWLEFLHQDIKGRLLALRRSKRRVQSAITIDIPSLIRKELTYNEDNVPNVATADTHRSRWIVLLDQMVQTLLEEERQLEIWLKQVKELRLQCDQGVQHLNQSSDRSMVQLGMPIGELRSGELNSDKELAVRAAAASLYSTCNHLMSKINVVCS